MEMITAALLLSCLFVAGLAVEKPKPVIILPPSFRWGAENEIVVTPIQTAGTVNVHFSVAIRTFDDEEKRLFFRKNFVTPRTDRPTKVLFNLEHNATVYEITIDVERNEKFVGYVHGTPNIRTIEVQTDKVFYKKGETVKVRALPITEEGRLYKGEISFNLWNPHNFKLQTKNDSAVDRFIDVEFKLPENLHLGEWKIVAIPNYAHRAVEDSTMHYAVTFEVQDYALPLIQALMDVKVAKDSETPMISISARYSHGTLVNGTVRVECKRGPDESNQYLSSLTMINGFVSSQIRVSQCFLDKTTTSTTVIAKVRDDSTSATAETRYELDIRVAGFDLVPLKPAFSDRSANFYVYVKAAGSPFEELPDAVHVNVTCLSTDDYLTKATAVYKTRIGEIVGIEGRWNGFHLCSAIMIFAQREISNAMLSRNVTLMIANMSTATSTNFNLIDSESPTKTSYRVGEEFRASVSRVASEYMVVCNTHEIADYGQVDHRKIRFKITEKMIPQCVLYVYSIEHSMYKQPNPFTDMWLFFVEKSCPYSSVPNKNEINPSEKLKIDIKGPKNGLALLHIVDTRMFGLLQRSFMYSPSTYWEMDNFGTHHTNRLRMVNFVDEMDFKYVLGHVCREAGLFYRKSNLGPCPYVGRSSSGISNYCQQQVMKSCLSYRTPLHSYENIQHPGLHNNQPPEGFHPYRGQGGHAANSDVNIASVFKIGPTHRIQQPPFAAYQPQPPQSAYDMRLGSVVPDLAAVAASPARDLSDDPVVGGQLDAQVKVRQHFPEVWLFNDIPLNSSGQAQTTLKSPDSIANWSIASTFWGPGQLGVCRPNPATVISKKEFYMIVDLPKHIYVNETIAADIIVTTENAFKDDYLILSVCISGIPYQTCVDQGPQGELGQEIYNQVNLTRTTRSGVRKTPIFFTKPGRVELVFSLRRQENIHVHHCVEGKIEDQIKMTINVEKRADTELFYKGIVISMDKPLKPESKARSSEKIDYDQARVGDKITTTVHVNLGEAEPQNLALELSKFLPTAPFNIPKSFRDEKRKLGVVPKRNLFLSEVLQDLSVKLYKLKSLDLHREKTLAEIEESEILEGEVMALVSDVNTFSNCTDDATPCGFAEYGAPTSDGDISIPLTAVSTMLLCQRGVDAKAVKGAITLLFSTVGRSLNEDREIDNILQDLPKRSDRIVLLQTLLYQVTLDCPENFLHMSNDLKTNRNELHKDLFLMTQVDKHDPRVIASLAYMSLTTTHDRARLQLNKRIQRNAVPFWSLNTTCQDKICTDELPNDVRQFVAYQNEKRNEVLLNSLGLLAYTNKRILNKSGGTTNLDHLADWIYEQKRSDEGYYSAMDTFFASRALFEYRSKHNSTAFFGNPKINIEFEENGSKHITELILDDNPLLIPIPSNVSTIHVVSEGDAKIKLGVQLVTSKRQRSKRHTQDDFLPVKITCVQQKIKDTYLRQEVCVQVKSRFLKTLQIDHALYTGFKSQPSMFDLMPKSKKSGARIIGGVEFSDYGAHVILTNLHPDTPTCYQIGISSSIDEPNNLAPVLISAISSDKGIVGQLYISHPDVFELRKRRRRRQTLAVNDAIDKICFEGGQCSCAEANCKVQCSQCENLSPTQLEKALGATNALGCTLKIRDGVRWYNTSNAFHSNYIIIPVVDVTDNKNKYDIWLRACNQYNCIATDSDTSILDYFKKDERFILIGNKYGSVVDSQQRRHYILTNDDYFEKAVGTCKNIFYDVQSEEKCAFN